MSCNFTFNNSLINNFYTIASSIDDYDSACSNDIEQRLKELEKIEEELRKELDNK